MSEELIEIRGLRKSFGRGDARLEVLKGIDLSVHHGEVMGVIGISGAGKSTLVRCINRLEPWDEGTIRIGGEDMGALSEGALNRKRQKIGMIFQQFNLLNSCTVFDNIALTLRYLRKRPEKIRQRVQRLLEIVDLTQKAHAYPSQLSGGQKQRVAIARALANEPEILLSDEATSALDPQTTESILRLLRRLNRELGLTIIVITHEMDVIRDICDRVAVIEKGEIQEIGTTYDVFAAPRSAVARRFVSSIIRDDGGARLRTQSIRSEPAGGVPVRLRIQGGETEDPLQRLMCCYGLRARVLYGDVELVDGRSVGCYVARLDGEAEQIQAALNDMPAMTRIETEARTDD